MKTKKQSTKTEKTYMVLPTPRQALVSFEQDGKNLTNVQEYDGKKWTKDKEHADLLQMAANCDILRSVGLLVKDKADLDLLMQTQATVLNAAKKPEIEYV